MTQQPTHPTDQTKTPPQGTSVSQGQRESFDPSGPHGGFGGAGGTQGSVYGDAEHAEGGPSEQRLEHEAWQRKAGKNTHGGVIPGEKGPYGDYGEIQDHHGGYWYGGREGGDQGKAPPAKPK